MESKLDMKIKELLKLTNQLPDNFDIYKTKIEKFYIEIKNNEKLKQYLLNRKLFLFLNKKCPKIIENPTLSMLNSKVWEYL